MTRIFVALLLSFCTTAWVQAADTVAGKALYNTCVACHGAAGQGVAALNSPALAGQEEAYLARQLNNFKAGIRGSAAEDVTGMQMRTMATTLNDDKAVADVTAYIAGLPAAGASFDTPGANLRNGENQYNAACGACHGGAAQGNANLNAPRLAGLDKAYLERQFSNFESGVRGSHPDDRLGRQMKMMTSMLNNEKDLADVIAFIGIR